MLPVVLWRRACQERRMELFEAMRANPDNAGLRAQFDQAVQDLVVVAVKMWALEVEWGHCCPSATASSAVASYK
jgi:hypothetical protein